MYTVSFKPSECRHMKHKMSSNSLLPQQSEPTRYANTYQLESKNPFNPDKVDKILKSVMLEAFENLTYDPEMCAKQAKWASLMIRMKVKELNFERYKIVCVVTIGEKCRQDLSVMCKFLWDCEKDRFATFTIENNYVFGIAYCFGLYYE
ncbi:unnamed protein product [Psylliodes chrysocephalus]|uniref:Uncharacterized protein n=1 Tax=Psylliodes chrysocephalus TaxID=3402493 RepID=A0A9P0GBY5_9CUCU|nr:unnamed protein product [Psylliodes chrysocephala]